MMDRYFLLTLSQILFTCAAILFVVREAVGKLSDLSKFLIFSIFAAFVYFSYEDRILLFLNSGNYLMDSHILALVSLALLLRVIRNNKIIDIILLAGSVIIGWLDGRLYIAWFVAPALIMLSSFLVFSIIYKSRRQKIFCVLFLAISISAVTAAFLDPVIMQWDALKDIGRVRFDFHAALNTIPVFIERFIELMLVHKFYLKVFMLLWAIGMLAVFYLFIKITLNIYFLAIHDSNQVKNSLFTLRPVSKSTMEQIFPWYALIVFTIILIFVNFLTVTASGEFGNAAGFKYYQVAITMPFLVLIGIFDVYYRKFAESREVKIFAFTAITLVITVFIFNFENIKPRKLSIDEVRHQKDVSEMNLAKCLDENKEKYNLKYGIGSFWIATTTNLFSEKGIRVYQDTGYTVDAGVYMNNSDWFLGAPGSPYSNPEYNFFVAGISLKPDAVIRDIGAPTASFQCSGTEILVYNDGRLDRIFKERAKLTVNKMKFERGVSDSFNIENPPAILNLELLSGNYKVVINYKIDGFPSDKHDGAWEISDIRRNTSKNGDLVILQAENTAYATFTIPFSLPGKRHPIEIKTTANGLRIESIGLERIK